MFVLLGAFSESFGIFREFLEKSRCFGCLVVFITLGICWDVLKTQAYCFVGSLGDILFLGFFPKLRTLRLFVDFLIFGEWF